jgi:DNA-binding transcriptional MocR family regulator
MSLKYDLNTGYPDLSLVPRGRLLEHLDGIFEAGRGMQYTGSLQGVASVREPVADFLTRSLGASVSPDELMIIPGTLYGIDLVCRTVARPGDIVLVEEPTFFFAVHLLKMSHVEVIGVPMSAQGIDLDALEDALKRYAGRVRLIYTIPSYHNPTGNCATAANRAGLARLAARYDVLALEDATYQVLYYGDPPPPALKTFDAGGEHVALTASVSKILMPSLRMGWIWASKTWIRQFLDYHTNSTPVLSADLVADYMASGEIDGQLTAVRAMLRRKHDTVMAALRENAPDWLEWNAPNGGYFLWARLPDGITASEVEKAAAAHDVAVMRGSLSYAQPKDDQTLRLCFAMLPESDLIEAVERLCAVLKGL